MFESTILVICAIKVKLLVPNLELSELELILLQLDSNIIDQVILIVIDFLDIEIWIFEQLGWSSASVRIYHFLNLQLLQHVLQIVLDVVDFVLEFQELAFEIRGANAIV